MSFSKEKFLGFYPGNVNVIKIWDGLSNLLKTSGTCPTCGGHTEGAVDPLIMAGILATIRIESGRNFTPIRENLNYSAQGLLATFPRYFTPQQAQQYAYKPEMIANRVYANRMGNGDESSGDGWRYRGANFLQFTGKSNWDYYGFNETNCLDIDKGIEATVKYFKDRNIIQFCLNKDFKKVRQLVNGGTNGLPEFLKVINDYLS